MGIAIFSYNGLATFGIIADSESTPDLDVLAQGIEEGIDELLALVRRGADVNIAAQTAQHRRTASMPQTKKATPSARRPQAFKEPPALKRLTKSLDTAQEALKELQASTRRDTGRGARDVYKDVRTFVSSARRDTGKLAKALAKDFEQAERRLSSSRTAPTARKRTAASRTTRKRTTSKRTSAAKK